MKLTKIAYISERVQVGTDWRGAPIYEEVKSDPFPVEVEPYSAKLAETNYGVFVEVTHRLFCHPNSFLELGKILFVNDEKYLVTELMQYDRHYEVLIKKEAS